MADLKSKTDRFLSLLRHRPLVPVVLAYIAGILLATYLQPPGWSGLVFAGAGLGFAFLGHLSAKRRMAQIALFGLFIGLGLFLMARLENPKLSPIHISNFVNGPKVTVQGRIEKPIVYHAGGSTAIVKAERIQLKHQAYMPVEGRLSLRLAPHLPPLMYGDTIQFETNLREMTAYGTKGVFNGKIYNHRRGIFVRASVRHAKHIQVVARKGGSPLKRFMEGKRQQIRDAIAEQGTLANGGVLRAIILGERQQIPKAVYAASKKSGTSHLYAISGMHIGSIFGIVFLITLRLLRLSARACRKMNIYKAAALTALIPAILYAEIAGWKISTIRALLMVLSFGVALIIGRQRDLLSAMAGAALVILLIWPYTLFEAGFQLSFGAAFAIAVVVPRMLATRLESSELDRLEQTSKRVQVARWFKLSLFTTVGAVLFTLPATAWHFGFIAPYGFLSNLFMVPLYTLLVVPASLLGTLFLFLFKPLSPAFFSIADHAIQVGIRFSSLIGKLPGSLINVDRPTGLEIIAYFLLLAAVLFIRKKGAKLLFGAAIAVLILTPLSFQLIRHNRDNLIVTVIDVGQGLSQFIEFPGGDTWLIDGGGSQNPDYDVGERIVGPFLRARHIHSIDSMINTHPHPDHFGGLGYVLEHFDVKHIILSPLEWNDEGDDRYAQLVQQAKGLGEGRFEFVRDSRKIMEINGVRIQWLYPPEQAFHENHPMSQWSINDRSMVIKLSYGDCTILLPSDIEAKAETWLVQEGGDLTADVLVCPHHGSRSSSTLPFLTAVRPKSVVIPVGRYNWWGFPTQDVLDRYNELGIEIYRTDIDGSVEITCTAEKSHIRTYFKK